MLYNSLIIPILLFIIKITSLFNPKLRHREKMWRESLVKVLELNDDQDVKNSKRLWFHAASMGEFEQAKPIIELIKKNDSKIIIIVSFFSPSGYENQKNYEYADAVVYLPFDKKKDVKYFLSVLRPDIAVFVRYEIWRNFLCQLTQLNVRKYLICATEPDSFALIKLPILKAFTRKNYNYFDLIFTVDKKQTNFFKSFGVETEIKTLSDTRFDRIAEKVLEASTKNSVPDAYFIDREFIIVLGSSWTQDEKLVFDAVRKWNSKEDRKVKMIVVPHEPTKEHIKEILSNDFEFVLLSSIEKNIDSREFMENNNSKHILVDSIGKLLMLYAYADAAYIGGGFGVGVHSVTEPAGYGIPISTGVGFKNSPDAVNLFDQKALSVVKTSNDFYLWLQLLINNRNKYDEKCNTAKKYISSKLGSSLKIYKFLIKDLG